jgi:hypothetical protein
MSKKIDKLAMGYSDMVYERVKETHSDYKWNAFSEGYLTALDLHLETAWKTGASHILTSLQGILLSEDSNVGKIARMKALIEELNKEV